MERLSTNIPTQEMFMSQKQSIFPRKEISCVSYGSATSRKIWKGVYTNNRSDVSRHLILDRTPNLSEYRKYRVGGVSDDGEIHLDIIEGLRMPK
ncbi:MAG: hypothetical protein NTV34_19875 [Proteobacteria bacterium]|nr:hypothetical protein [Pseudomonadota bacterium]